MVKICNICFKIDTRGNQMISIQMSALDRIAEGLTGAAPALPRSSGPDLQPTNYCTSMWNGRRCNGEHDEDWGDGGIIHASTRDDDSLHSVWRDGYDGVDIHKTPYELGDDVDFDPGWGPLEQMHADGALPHPWLSGSLLGEVLEMHDDVWVCPTLGGPTYALLADGWTPFDADGNLCDLESEGWHVLGAMTDDQPIRFDSEYAGIFVRGLMETFVDADSSAWFGTLLNV